jgi:methionine sulfoxide reductase heme-binding subunit
MTFKTNRNHLHKFWIWAILTLPGIYILVRYLTDAITYGQVIHETGDWSVGFLFLALAATPFRRVLSKARWPRWLMAHRRAIGVASFAYAAFHTITYLERKWGYGYILEEAKDPGLFTGWIALVIFLVLAITSNNPSVRALRKNWKHLHRTVYIATGLTFAHWIFTAIEPQTAYISLGALCLVECLRFIRLSDITELI